jgi:hypothetical protein
VTDKTRIVCVKRDPFLGTARVKVDTISDITLIDIITLSYVSKWSELFSVLLGGLAIGRLLGHFLLGGMATGGLPLYKEV